MTKESKRPFLDLFSKFHPDEPSKLILDGLSDYSYRLNKETRDIRIDFYFPKLVPKYRLYAIEAGIKSSYDLNSCFIFPKYPPELFTEAYKNELILELSRSTRMAKGFFDDCKMTVSESEVVFDMKDGYAKLPSTAECERILEEIIRQEFGRNLTVTLRAGEFDLRAYNEKYNYTMLFETATTKVGNDGGDQDVFKPVQRNENSVIPTSLQDDTEFSFDRENLIVHSGYKVFDLREPVQVYGRKYKEADLEHIHPLKNLCNNLGNVTFCGYIIPTEKPDVTAMRGTDGLRLKFYVSDDASSVTVKVSGDTDKVAPLEGLKPNTPVLINGSMRFDPYENDYIVKPNLVCKINTIGRTDDAREKRVELHFHTKMSTMDATVEPKDVVKQAAAWGHKAVAITDHGNLQGFPEAMLAAKDLRKEKNQEIKVLYGIEGYFVDDTSRAIFGEAHGSFKETEFVIFDIETTGLSPLSCQITEIGAVLFKNGEVLSTFSTFADPGTHIPDEITQITGITDDMVKGAPTPAEAVRRFLDFAGERLLIAHNANFDMGFIKKVAEDNGIPLSNAYLDTLALSRSINPELKKHKLDTLQEYFGLADFNHHRAFEDAAMLGQIFSCMIEKMGKSGIVDLDGMTASMAASSDPKKIRDVYHIVLFAKNLVGLKNLYKIVSRSYLDYYARRPRIPKSLLQEYREGLLVGSACSEGELYQAILEGKSFGDLLRITEFYDYLEVMPCGNNGYLLRNGQLDSVEKLREINRTIVKLAEKKNKICVATGDVHFLNPHDQIGRKILLAGMKMKGADEDVPLYFRTTNEMLEEFSYFGEEKAKELVITNPNKIADMIDAILPIPDGQYPPSIEGAVEELNRSCYEKAHAMYGDPLPDIVGDRLKRELDAIEAHGFSVLYVIARRLVKNSEEKGYLVGSRGSVGSSFVATMGGISEVNPLVPHYLCPNPDCKHSEFITDGSVGSGFDLDPKDCPLCGTPMKTDGHNIPFETFLGFNGDKSPDIDLNFSGDVQADAHQYTEELFGKGNVYRAGTLGTLADKNAFGYVKKYLEEHGKQVNLATEKLLISKCSGVKKTTGQHPGGIIVIPRDKDVYDFTPIQHPADGEGTKTITTHFAFKYLHDTVLKLDILGHDVPTKYKMLEKYSGINVLSVPMKDEKVMSLFESPAALNCDLKEIGVETGTLCLPEFGTKFVRQMLMDTKPKTFADLLQISGLSHGTNVWVGNAQDLIRENVCTISDVIGTRDDIMTYLIYHDMDKKESFDIMEKVRKGKGLTPEMEEDMKKHNVPDWYISSCKKIKYMFPKAHAAAYVISAIRLAWFKVYHPVEFYCAYFSAAPEGMDQTLIRQGKEGILSILRNLEGIGKLSQKEKATSDAMQITYEILSRGIEILPVHLFKSDAKLFLPEDGKIRLPFISIPGLGLNAAESIVQTVRENNIYSVEEFKEKSGMGKGVMETLRTNGAFEGMPESNQLSLFD